MRGSWGRSRDGQVGSRREVERMRESWGRLELTRESWVRHVGSRREVELMRDSSGRDRGRLAPFRRFVGVGAVSGYAVFDGQVGDGDGGIEMAGMLLGHVESQFHGAVVDLHVTSDGAAYLAWEVSGSHQGVVERC